MRGQMVRRLRPAHDGLYQVSRVTAGLESGFCYMSEMLCAPRSVLGGLEHQCRASEEGRYQGRDEVVEGVTECVVSTIRLCLCSTQYLLPAHTSSQNSQRLPSDLVMFVHHEKVRRSSLRL